MLQNIYVEMKMLIVNWLGPYQLFLWTILVILGISRGYLIWRKTRPKEKETLDLW